jgi:hypothetical protein
MHSCIHAFAQRNPHQNPGHGSGPEVFGRSKEREKEWRKGLEEAKKVFIERGVRLGSAVGCGGCGFVHDVNGG